MGYELMLIPAATGFITYYVSGSHKIRNGALATGLTFIAMFTAGWLNFLSTYPTVQQAQQITYVVRLK